MIKPEQQVRVAREIVLQSGLFHPNVVTVYDVLETAEDVFIVMEYCPNGQLFDLIVARQKLPTKDAQHYFRQILSAVAYCHKVRFCYAPPLPR